MKPKVLRPFFSFYGGKWRDCKRLYPAPTHDRLVEPFAGSAGYSLRYHDRKVLLCDADPVIYGVWDYLLHVTPNEILSIPDVDLDGELEDLHLCPEARNLVGFWLNRASAKPGNQPSAWMRTGKWPNSFWGDRVRNTIASQLEYIKHWKVVHKSYDRLNVDKKSTWFVDPPYHVQGRHYIFGSRDIDYKHLGRWCRDLPGQVIVCEAKGATWLPFEEIGNTKTTRKKNRSEEALWVKN